MPFKETAGFVEGGELLKRMRGQQIGGKRGGLHSSGEGAADIRGGKRKTIRKRTKEKKKKKKNRANGGRRRTLFGLLVGEVGEGGNIANKIKINSQKENKKKPPGNPERRGPSLWGYNIKRFRMAA